MIKTRPRFRCPKCRGTSLAVIRTTTSYDDGFQIRRRRCSDCGHLFYTGQEPEFLLRPDQMGWKDGHPFILPETNELRHD